MGKTDAKGRAAAFAAEEERLARAAAGGDGSAFAALYERYETPAYNFAYRITGSEPDSADATQQAFLRAMRRFRRPQDDEPDFASSLFMAARKACHDLLGKSRAVPASETEPHELDVAEANLRLSEHQREALALRELGKRSYDEIATILETSRGSVAQLTFRARINLRDEMHGTALATASIPSECERALRLIAEREDEQLQAGSEDDAWLDAHLAECERCGLAVEAMRETGAAYRAWEPIAAVPWLLEETMAKAAAQVGADWSGAIAAALASRGGPRSSAGQDLRSSSGQRFAYLSGRDGDGWSSRRRRAIATAGLAALLVVGGVAAGLAGDERSAIAGRLAADANADARAPASKREREKRDRRDAARTRARTEPTSAVAASPALSSEAGEGGSSEPATPAADQQEPSGVQPPQTVTAPKPKPDRSTQPAPTGAPQVEAPPPPPPPPPEDPAPENPGKGKGPPIGIPPRDVPNLLP